MALIEIRDVSRVYDLGEVKVEALDPRLALDRKRRIRRSDRPFRLRQEHADEYARLFGPPDERQLQAGRRRSCDDVARGARHIRNRRIGFVFQNFNLLARTSALENVELPLLYTKGVSASERRRRAIEKLELVGLANRLEHQPNQLSGGQQQRVAIARALVNEPAILLADEPTGNLDSKTSREVVALFRELNEKSGITIILVTHNQRIARDAKRMVVMRDGAIVCDTTDFHLAAQVLQEDLDGDGEELLHDAKPFQE